MNLHKDNQNIYTIESENYIQYMHEYEKKSKSLLTKVIKFLLLTLLLIVSYFLYQVVKSDHSFSEIFHKHVEKKAYVEVLNKKETVLSVTKEYKKPIVIHNNSKVVKKVEEVNKEKSKETILSQKYLDLISEELK